MKPDRIIFKQVFPSGIQYLPLHIGVEYPVLPDEEPDEVMKAAVEQVRKWNLEYNPSYAMAMEMNGIEVLPVVQKTNESSKESATQRIIDQINGSSSEAVLLSFKLLTKNNPALQEAYDNKLKSFK